VPAASAASTIGFKPAGLIMISQALRIQDIRYHGKKEACFAQLWEYEPHTDKHTVDPGGYHHSRTLIVTVVV